MTRRWRFTLVAAVIAVLSAAPILSSTTASAMPLSSKVASVAVPAEPGAGLASLWNSKGTEIHVFYVGTDNQISNWYGDGTKWDNAGLGVGEPAAVGTGLTALWNPGETQINVFYVGTLGQIYNWIWDGKKWTNKVLGVGEPAALGTGLASYWNPDGKQANVFYVGADGKVYNWYGNGSTWANAVLGDGKGEPAALGTGLAAYWNSGGTGVHVFYVGADRNLYNWYGDGKTWTNAALGGGGGEPAAIARGLAAFWHPDGIQANVFYEGIDGQIYNWAWDGTTWTNSALGNGEPAGQGTGMAALWNPDGKSAHVFYVADKGQPYNAPVTSWDLTGTTWTNGQL